MEESSIRVSLELLWKWRLQQQQQQQAHARVVRDVSSVLEAQQNVVNKQRKTDHGHHWQTRTIHIFSISTTPGPCHRNGRHRHHIILLCLNSLEPGNILTPEALIRCPPTN